MSMIALFVAAVALLLSGASEVAGGRQFRCECTVNCGDSEGICFTEYQCYTQFMRDDIKPIAYGCISRGSLLCESWLHRVANHSESKSTPAVLCCDSDLCNRPKPPTPPRGFYGASLGASADLDDADAAHDLDGDLSLSGIIADAEMGGRPGRSHMYPLNQPLVLTALFAGLLVLLAVLTFGFYMLYKQSRAVKSMWKTRGQGDMALALVETPPAATTC